MNASILFMTALLLITTIISSTLASPQCVDDSGKPVDWFIIYKFPYLKKLNRTELFGGYHYASQTSENHQDGWHFSKYQVNESRSILGRTLAPFFSKNRTHLTAMFYNDQPPTGKNVPTSYAHAKGMIVSDQKQGFWLIHTVPKFMPANDKYSYPNSGGRYGQVAMCISLPASELAKVVEENFLIARPYVYHIQIDSASEKTDLGKALAELEQRKWIKANNFTNLYLKSKKGQKFQSFYKSPSHKVDLYSDIVAISLKTSLRVETWRHNPGNPLSSECVLKNAEVENIKRIKLKFVDSKLRGDFSYYDDHSKWAITRDKSKDFVCIGDINRVHSQFHRGGGTTCISKTNVWNNFNSFIGEIERCPDDPEVDRELPKKSWWNSIVMKINDYFNQKQNNQ